MKVCWAVNDSRTSRFSVDVAPHAAGYLLRVFVCSPAPARERRFQRRRRISRNNKLLVNGSWSTAALLDLDPGPDLDLALVVSEPGLAFSLSVNNK